MQTNLTISQPAVEREPELGLEVMQLAALLRRHRAALRHQAALLRRHRAEETNVRQAHGKQ